MNWQTDGQDTSSRNAADQESAAPNCPQGDEPYSRRQEAAIAGPEWFVKGHLNQLPPEEVRRKMVDVWLVTGGRGAGKTRTGAEWVNGIVHGYAPFVRDKSGLIALVGETLADVRDVMVEGPAGILACGRKGAPRFEPSRRRVVWANGAQAILFSSEDPESLRGPQFSAAWCDEIGKWKNAEATWDMLQFGLRLGERPQLLATTTPRPTPLVKRLHADPHVTVTRIRTEDNAAHLADGWLERLKRRYAGTALGRQELDGDLLEDREDALWRRPQLDALRSDVPDGLQRIVVAVDPPASSGASADACGIVAAGLTGDGIAHVLADASVEHAPPAQWAAAAVRLYHALQADCIIAEVNQGGEMVAAVIRTVDPSVPVKPTRAQRGKWLRAEPVAALYEQQRVRHAGHFARLEDEMCNFGRDGLSGGRSPDRVDALVWAVSELVFGAQDGPRVRAF